MELEKDATSGANATQERGRNMQKNRSEAVGKKKASPNDEGLRTIKKARIIGVIIKLIQMHSEMIN